jgi:transposase
MTISRIAEDWYLSFAYEQPEQVTIKQFEVVGVDLGIKTKPCQGVLYSGILGES